MKTKNLLMALSLLGLISCGTETTGDLPPVGTIEPSSTDSAYTRSYRVSYNGCTTGQVEVRATSAEEAKKKLCDDMLERYKLNYCGARFLFKIKINSNCGSEHITAMNTWSDDDSTPDTDDDSDDTDVPQNDDINDDQGSGNNDDVSDDQGDDNDDDVVVTNPTLVVLTDRISTQTTVETFDYNDETHEIIKYEILLDGKKAFWFISEDNRQQVLVRIMKSELFTNKHPEFTVINHDPFHYGKKMYNSYDTDEMLTRMERLERVGFFSKKHNGRIYDGDIYMDGRKALNIYSSSDLIDLAIKLLEGGGFNQTRATIVDGDIFIDGVEALDSNVGADDVIAEYLRLVKSKALSQTRATIKNGDIYIDGYKAFDFWQDKEALTEFIALAEMGAFANHRGNVKDKDIYLDGRKAFDFYSNDDSLQSYKELFLAGAFLPHSGTVRDKKIYIGGIEVYSTWSSSDLYKEFLRLLEAGKF